mgnify:CR=1 FL=1
MANLHFHYGVMGSLKSVSLISSEFNFRKTGVKVEVLKPSFDNRFSESEVVSRMGGPENMIRTPAIALPSLDNYSPKKDTKVLLIDEVQFFKPSDIDKLVKFADEMGIIVMCYGLTVDSNEHLFPAAQRLMEVGATLHLIESNCQKPGCLRKATHHLRYDKNRKLIREGEQFSIGDESYESVCRKCFNQAYYGKSK